MNSIVRGFIIAFSVFVVSSNIAGSLPIHSPFAIANLGGMSSELFLILDTQDLQKVIIGTFESDKRIPSFESIIPSRVKEMEETSYQAIFSAFISEGNESFFFIFIIKFVEIFEIRLCTQSRSITKLSQTAQTLCLNDFNAAVTSS
jgi:hypothetical protein